MKNKCDRLNMGLKENGGYMIQAFPCCYFMLLLMHRGVFHIDTSVLMKVVSYSRNTGSYYVPEEANKKYNTIH